jgi:hypothetical protein
MRRGTHGSRLDGATEGAADGAADGAAGAATDGAADGALALGDGARGREALGSSPDAAVSA